MHNVIIMGSFEIYGDDPVKTEEAIDRMTYSSEVWSFCDNTPSFSLCDNAPSFQDNLTLRSELEYDQQVIEINQRLVYQGVLNN